MWQDFNWKTASDVREAAAMANSRSFPQPQFERDMAPLFSAEEAGLKRDASQIDEFFLIWAGELNEDAQTSGWLGAPTLDDGSWLAVEEQWVDGGEEPIPGRRRGDGPNSGEPNLELSLKRMPRRASK